MSGLLVEAPAIEPLGEDALLLRFGSGIDATVNQRVHAFAAMLEADPPPWLREVVPAYASLALLVDPDRMATAHPEAAADPLPVAQQWLRTLLVDRGTPAPGSTPVVEIPVCYGGDDGPDLDAVAAHSGLAREEVVARHLAGDYRVAMLGFAPGFPYLLGLDPRLATPRLATPRTRVAAGSVGIGGAQAGIYPREGPGGWRIIGRTPLQLFDAARQAPALLAPGVRVRFVEIDPARFRQLAGRRR